MESLMECGSVYGRRIGAPWSHKFTNCILLKVHIHISWRPYTHVHVHVQHTYTACAQTNIYTHFYKCSDSVPYWSLRLHQEWLIWSIDLHLDAQVQTLAYIVHWCLFTLSIQIMYYTKNPSVLLKHFKILMPLFKWITCTLYLTVEESVCVVVVSAILETNL